MKRPNKKETKKPAEIRLNRYIANAGVCSRREADNLIAEGRIKVNGKVKTEMGYKVKSFCFQDICIIIPCNTY